MSSRANARDLATGAGKQILRRSAPQDSKRRAKSAAFFWGVFLLVLTSWPTPPRIPVISGIPDFDKAIHFLLYGVEAYLLYRAIAWPGRSRFSLARILAIAGIMACWGMADEVHQYWIPGRSMEAGDVGADAAGATSGALIASVVSRRRSVGEGLGPSPLTR